MTYIREHDAAKAHPVALAGEKKADAAVKRLRAAHRARAEKLRAKAEKLLDEASELSYLADKYSEIGTPYATLREKVEDEAYWEARKIVGVFPRDKNGTYVDPAPFWTVCYKGEFIGEFQGEEYCDVLRVICPPHTDERKWSDFEVVRIVT